MGIEEIKNGIFRLKLKKVLLMKVGKDLSPIENIEYSLLTGSLLRASNSEDLRDSIKIIDYTSVLSEKPYEVSDDTYQALKEISKDLNSPIITITTKII